MTETEKLRKENQALRKEIQESLTACRKRSTNLGRRRRGKCHQAKNIL